MKNLLLPLCSLVFGFGLISPYTASAQDGEAYAIHRLKKLSIEELMNIEVTSVTRSPQKLASVASAIQVITAEDIRRSGATNIPEALRLASNLQVSQLNSSSWIISARGFNTVFANKLLVLIDGRTVYTPLFAGVLWDQQHVLLDDVDRIEVISGPGASMWGANAVNGVINIITKNVADTQGLYASASVGTFLERSAAIRYGGKLSNKLSFRVYGQHQSRNHTYLPEGLDNNDAWSSQQAGLRLAYEHSSKDLLTIEGDLYSGERETTPTPSPFDGQNLIARWTHTDSDRASYTIQTYYDRYWRNDRVAFADELNTFDIDFQYARPVGEKHNILLGGGYRHVTDHVYNRTTFGAIAPGRRVMPVYSFFIQDEFKLSAAWNVIVGTRMLHNVFSGFEFQPNLRVAWSLDANSTLWAAVSRAIRQPSRLDKDYFLPVDPQPPSIPSVAGGPNFDSEKLWSYELGYKIQPNAISSISISTFYHDYSDVYSVEPLPGTFTYQIQNGSDAESWGLELSGFYQIASWWRLRAGFTYFDKDLRAKPGRMHDPSYLANDVKHQALAQSMIDLPWSLRFDLVARYLDYIPPSFATARVPEYTTFDVRFAWEGKHVELAVIGQNLASDRHAEFGLVEIPRGIFGKLTVRY